jgi:hypothetical protein
MKCIPWLLMLSIVLLLASGCRQAPELISADVLCRDYMYSQETADGQYKGKYLHVLGEASIVDIDNLGNHYVILTHGFYYGCGVLCQFADEGIADWASLQEGDEVLVGGKCEGCSKALLGKGEPSNVVLRYSTVEQFIEKARASVNPTTVQDTPAPVLEIPPAEQITSSWFYAIIGISIALSVTLVVLAVKLRRLKRKFPQ